MSLAEDPIIQRMMPFFSMLLCIAIFAAFPFSLSGAPAAKTHAVKLLYFFSEECDHCRHVDEFVLGPLQEAYPIRVERISIDEDEG